MEDREVFGGELGRQISEVVVGSAEETRAADGGFANFFPDARRHDPHDCADERARGVIFDAVAPGVAHVLDLGFVKVGKLVFFGLGMEPQLINRIDDVP